MTRRDIAKEIIKALPDEFLSGKSAQLAFDFAIPDSKGIQKAERYVKVIVGTVKEILKAGEVVEISGFGKFTIRHKKERAGRNPRTKEAAAITARKVISFKASRLLKNKVNNGNG